MLEDLKFQRYAHDKRLSDSTAAEGAFKPTSVKRQMLLSPEQFHRHTTDKTLAYELEKAIDPLKDLLK